MDLRNIFSLIPEVRKPDEKKLGFNVKLKWTLIILVAFFVLGNITLYGLSSNFLERFEFLSTVLAADFGSIISLGIGPIVMASIILQLLTGAGIINIDTTTPEGKKFFQGVQKLLVFFFIVFESMIYVLMKAFGADPTLGSLGPLILIVQLIFGGLLIFYMDEVCHKWGFGSGVSLFIAAGVSRRLITAAFQFIRKAPNGSLENCLLDFNGTACSGKVFIFIQSIINKSPIEATSALAAMIVTVLIFMLVVWAQSLKIEVPLSFGRIKGYAVKWPLSFFYASVIPVILTAALVANVQLFGGIIENAAQPCITGEGVCGGMANFASHFTFLGSFTEQGQAVSGLAFWMSSTNILDLFIRGGFMWKYLLQGITHMLFFMIFSTIFALFWVKTSGMDSKAVAKNIKNSGLHLAGFRQDERVLESILDRYIIPLTIMGGAAVGLLASFTNLLGALVSGTAMLLVIMIMFQFYQNIAKDHAMDMNPAMKKFMGS